jgi:hypothetical protein
MMVAEAATSSFAPIPVDPDEDLATPTMDADLEGLL